MSRRILMPLLAAVPLLASCGGGNFCWNCVQGPAPEVSLGLVAGNLTGNGAESVVATSTVLASPQANPGNLKVYLSTGPGAFAAAFVVADGHEPLYLASADLNGDHLPDVVSASYADGALAVYLNNAQTPGTFAAPQLLPSPGASQVAIADVNGDGLTDLVSADFNVSLFLQTAPGVFAAPVALYPGGANWVAVGDVNGDGYADILVATGPPQAAVNGVIPNAPGVLLQNTGSPGVFGALRALP